MSKLAKLPPRLPTQQQRVAAASISASTGSAERQRLYRTARWLRLRIEQLQRCPLCVLCEREGIVRAAEVADHRDGHRGNWRARFWDLEGLQSLCLDHHRAKSGNEYAEWLKGNG
jgi:5-methylcytosine-specific restriction protein A